MTLREKANHLIRDAAENVHSSVKSMSIWLKSVDNRSVSQFFNDICVWPSGA